MLKITSNKREESMPSIKSKKREELDREELLKQFPDAKSKHSIAIDPKREDKYEINIDSTLTLSEIRNAIYPH